MRVFSIILETPLATLHMHKMKDTGSFHEFYSHLHLKKHNSDKKIAVNGTMYVVLAVTGKVVLVAPAPNGTLIIYYIRTAEPVGVGTILEASIIEILIKDWGLANGHESQVTVIGLCVSLWIVC